MYPTTTLTPSVRRSAREYIDDIATDVSDSEGEPQHPLRVPPPANATAKSADDNDIQPMDDPDSAEAQARAHDNAAYNMRAIDEGHETRLRAAEPYRVPKALLAPPAPIASTSREVSAPTPAPAAAPTPARPLSPFDLGAHIFGKKRPASPEWGHPPKKLRHLEETPQLRNHFLVEPTDMPEPCDPIPNDFAPNRE
jgi:hypothetical protein